MDNMPDLVIEGNGNVWDSFSLALTSILKHWGKKYDHKIVSGLSGTAFSPAFDPGEDCMAWWMEHGNDCRMPFLSKVLGFSFTEHKTTTQPKEEKERQYKIEAKKALSEGKVLLEKTWPLWTIVHGWDEDKDEPIRASFEGFPMFQTYGFYALQNGQAVAHKNETEKEAVDFGSKIAKGTLKNAPFVYGGSLYEEAAKRLDEEWFCVPCKKDDWGCAQRTLARMRGSQMAAKGFIEQIEVKDEATTETRNQLAETYGQMADLILPYLKDEQFEAKWKTGDLKKALKKDFAELSRLHKLATSKVKDLSQLL